MGIFGRDKNEDRLNLNNLDVERGVAKLEYSTDKPLENEKDEIYAFLEELEKILPEDSGYTLRYEGKWYRLGIAHFLRDVWEDNQRLEDELRKAQELTRKAREENARLKHYLKQLDGLEGYAKWMKAQKQGRKPKEINIDRYHLLKKAKVNQKEIAKLLGVSPNTLRKILREKGLSQD